MYPDNFETEKTTINSTTTLNESFVKSDVMRSKWFKMHQIQTFVGKHDEGEMKKLVILHECGDDKEALINQLKAMIEGIKTDFEGFAG